jgi:hypothetical protein
MYRIEHEDATLEIEGNIGTIILTAASPRDALKRARRIFPHMRDTTIAGTADRYRVDFKVSHRYKRSLLNKARALADEELSREYYDRLEPMEKYMALKYAQITGKDTFLGDPAKLHGAVLALQNELVRQGYVQDPNDLMDYDIAAFNAAEIEA